MAAQRSVVPLSSAFAVRTGSVPGREHLRVHKNNQDGVAQSVCDGAIVLAVTDGCSSGRFSEVGARLAAAWLARATPAFLGGSPLVSAQRTTVALLDFTRATAQAFVHADVCADLHPHADTDANELARAVADYFLFTFLVAVVLPDQCFVFGVGDGVVSVDGRAQVLDAGEANAPDYIAYALLRPDDRPLPSPTMHFSGATERLTSLVIATDGAIELAGGPALGELETEARYVRNASLLQKRLNMLGPLGRALHDDTTLAMIRRKGVLS